MRHPLLPLLLAFALAAPAAAQSTDAARPSLSELKTQLAAGKQTVIARALDLTPAEEADFWPVFDELQAGLAELATRRREARASIANGGERAEDGVEALVEADLRQAELFERAWSRLRGSLPADKLGRYLTLERRIAAIELL